MSPHPSPIVEVLDECAAALRSGDVAELHREELVALLRRTRSLQAAADGFVQRLALAQAEREQATDAATFLLDGGTATSGRSARREARRHRFVLDNPHLADAAISGTLPAESLDALERAAGRLGGDERARFLEQVPALVTGDAAPPVDVFAAQVADAERSARADHGDDELAAQIAASSMRRWTDLDTGMRHTLLVLDPVRDTTIHTAISKKLRQLRHADRGGELGSIDAAVALLGDRRPPGPARAGVGVIVDASTLLEGPHDATVCELTDGTPVPPTTLDRFLCDPVLTLLGTDRAQQVHAAIAARTASDLQRAALRTMHPTCAHPGCDVAFDNCQMHHLVHWRDGGPTELANLFPLCSTHHHDVHDRGWNYDVGLGRTLIPVPPDRRISGPTAPAADHIRSDEPAHHRARRGRVSTRPRTRRRSGSRRSGSLAGTSHAS